MAKHRTTEQRLAAAQEQVNRLRKQQRTEDTRRRVLVGAMYISRSERDGSAHHQLMRDLDQWLTAKRDRALFELGPIRGLYAATLQPASQPAGWSLGVTLKADQLQSILG